MSETFDIIIVGAGLSGLLTALALNAPHRRVALLDAGTIERTGDDGRATTLVPSALRMLRRLGVELPPAQPVSAMRVGEGEADSPWQFELPERDGEPLAHIVENEAFRAALLEALGQTDIVRFDGITVTGLEADGRIRLHVERDGDDAVPLDAALCVACDGRQSTLRRLAGLSVSAIDFGQKALVTTVRHDEPHEGIALQRFQPVGAVASLPLPGAGEHLSQIVWSDRAVSVEAAAALPSEALAALIDERLWNALDVTSIAADVQTYPLLAQRSEALTAPRLALVGDSARTIHPLAGQGFNLAVRDIAALAHCVNEADGNGQDIGMAGLLDYPRWRRADETRLAGLTMLLSAAPARGPGSGLGHLRRLSFALVDEIRAFHPLIRQGATAESRDAPQLLRA